MMETTMVRAALAGALLTGMVAGCGIGGGSVETTTLENDGRVCLSSQSGGSSDGVPAGILKATVDFNTCLSSSCDTVKKKECHVSLNGQTVTVESSATIEQKGGACTDDCGFVSTTCLSPPLEEGDYTLVHGDRETAFSLPADDTICDDGTSPAPQ